MESMSRAVIFDVDGTLLNPEEGVCAAVQHVISMYGLPPLSYEELLTFNGPPIQKSFSEHYQLEVSECQKLADEFRKRYKNHDLYLAKVYSGIYEAMNSLKHDGIKMGIATYKRHDYAFDLMQYLHFDEYTGVICGADNYNRLKKEDIVRNCLEKLQVVPENAVMVGDSDNDAIAASRIGMQFLGVTYGFGFSSVEDMRQYCPLGCAESPEAIYPLLKKWYGGNRK